MESIQIKGKWPGGISNGLAAQCTFCGRIPKFDYRVDRPFWKRVVAEYAQRGVLCLPCLDKRASERGLDVAAHLKFVQYTGIGKTIVLIPKETYYYGKERGADR